MWDDPFNQTDSVAGGIPAGTYKAIITDANGCMDSVSATLTEPTALSLTTVADSTSCNGFSDGKATTTSAGGTSNFNYVWSSGSSTFNTAALIDSATGLTAGTYYVTVTDNKGCTATDSTTVEQPLDVTISVVQDTSVLCNGDSNGVATVFATYGATPYNYMWSTGDTLLNTPDTSHTMNGLSAGTYFVLVSDANGCINSDSVVLMDPSAMFLATTVYNHVTCAGAVDGFAGVNNLNTGTSPWDFVWSTGDSTMGTVANFNDLLNIASGTYIVTVTDANGCTATDSLTVTEPTVLSITTSTVDAACGVSDGSATAIPAGGTGLYTYIWNDPSAQTTATATGLAANSYTVAVTDSNNCLATANVSVSNIGGATITTDSVVNLACNADANGSISISVIGGSIPLTYAWSNSATTEDITGLAAGSYSVTITDGVGCISILDTTVSEPTAIVVAMASTNITCFAANDGDGTAAVTGGTSPYTYLWDDLSAQTTMSALGLALGTFTVNITDAVGCTSSGNVTISEPAAIVVAASATDNCMGESTASATATATGGAGSFTYTWDDLLTQSTATATGLSSGPYTVTVEDGSGCIQTAAATVNSLVLPIISAGPDETIALGGSVSVTASGGLFYNWTPSTGLSCTSCQTTVATPITTTEYVVFGTAANSCSNSDTISVIVNDKISLYVPDIFSPNGDGENDYIFVQGLGIKTVEKFIIYDRWGEKVFENSDFQVFSDKNANKLNGWNGQFKGSVMNPGVFVFYVKVIFSDESIQEEKGDITLVH